jgi:hypothetical protein
VLRKYSARVHISDDFQGPYGALVKATDAQDSAPCDNKT